MKGKGLLPLLLPLLILLSLFYLLSLSARGDNGEFARERADMVREDIERRGVRDPAVLR